MNDDDWARLNGTLDQILKAVLVVTIPIVVVCAVLVLALD